MLDSKTLYGLSKKRSTAAPREGVARTTFDEYLKSCRHFIDLNKPKEYTEVGLKPARRIAIQQDLIIQFVNAHPVDVDRYVKDGVMDSEAVLTALLDSISGYGILREAFEDEDIDEIQINDHLTIFVVRKGVNEPYCRADGTPYQFSSPDEVLTLVMSLIDDGKGNRPELSQGSPVLTASTHQHGYRVAGGHFSIIRSDKFPYDYPIYSFVIRKFKTVRLTLGQLVASGMLTSEMGTFLELLGRSKANVFMVGETGSGKTTTLNVISSQFSQISAGSTNVKRVFGIQNPTEIALFDRDEYGRNRYNVLHYEVSEKASMAELLALALRSTPDIILLGEARYNVEFAEMSKGLTNGERFVGTFHAGGASEAMVRAGAATASHNKSDVIDEIRNMCKYTDVVCAQRKFDIDGKRKIMEITEILGYDEVAREPKVNVLFKYVQGAGDVGSAGHFEQVGRMSEGLRRKMLDAGISPEILDLF